MTVRYEANPPKIVPGIDSAHAVSKFVERIAAISASCDSVHLTEDVLGFQRVSPIVAGRLLRNAIPGLSLTASLRVRDKTAPQIQKFVDECTGIGFAGMLVLMGDPSRAGRRDSGETPSAVVSRLHDYLAGSGPDLYLSVPNAPDFGKLGKKIRAGPKGFITQVVQSAEQVRALHDGLPEFDIIPIVLFPSEKNSKSAQFLNIDFAKYGGDFAGFASEIHAITGDILITSPNDFDAVREFLDASVDSIRSA